MKKLLLLICLSTACVAGFAQPTSFGGITPGQTTREDLKNLLKNPDAVRTADYVFLGELKQPEGQKISIRLHNNVVYEVTVGLNWFSGPSAALRQALIEKYGQPNIKVGAIRTVTCRNKLGASFERLDGEEELKWAVKDGVQGGVKRWAGECAEQAYQDYKLRHVATVEAVEKAELEQSRKAAEDRRQKLGNDY